MSLTLMRCGKKLPSPVSDVAFTKNFQFKTQAQVISNLGAQTHTWIIKRNPNAPEPVGFVVGTSNVLSVTWLSSWELDHDYNMQKRSFF